jgi:hypothetical protein
LARRGRAVLLLLVVALVLGASGCGEEGAEEGATLNVYVSAPGQRLCDEARKQAAQGGEGDEFELRVVCLDASGAEGDWTLAKVGSNARRATEDSASIAYIGEPTREARKQSQPIIEAAEIAAMGSRNGKEAIEAITAALEDDDSDDPRAAVYDAIEG